MKTLEDLRSTRLALSEEAQGVQAAADAEGRQLTADEMKRLDTVFAEFDSLSGEITRRERIEAQAKALAAPTGRQTSPEPPVNSPVASQRGRVEVGNDLSSGRNGWRNMGEFAAAVKAASRAGAQADPRLLINAPTSYGSEGVGADGGFAVPPDFREAIWKKVNAEDSLLAQTDQLQTSGNAITVPKDETTPWGTGGIQAYWEGEGTQHTQSKPSLETSTIRLPKLSCLVPVTEELLEDAPALDGYLRAKVPEVMDFKVSLAILQGTGAGQPLGILNSPCLVSVAKETSQVADTIVAENIMKMWSRCYAPSRRNAVWLINQDCEAQLMQMSLKIKNVAGTENVGGFPLYIPAGGLSAAPYGTLMGRPIIPTQACETVGDQGDIVLADLSKYATVRKSGGIRTDTSIHLFFDYDVVAYRFIFRLGGQPWWSQAITPRDSSNTLSPFVTLDARS